MGYSKIIAIFIKEGPYEDLKINRIKTTLNLKQHHSCSCLKAYEKGRKKHDSLFLEFILI